MHSVQCESSFGQLTDTEALYAYYMARASWDGAKVCWFQRSYEGPALFVLLKLVFGKGIDTLKEQSIAAGVTEEQWAQFITYSAAVFNNCGNFKSFGDTKFVPELDNAAFKKIFESSSAFQTH